MFAGLSPRIEAERRKTLVYLNGHYDKASGKILYLPEEMSMPQLLNAAGRRLNMNAQRVFNSDGREIDDLILIDPGDMLFFSDGADFIVPNQRRRHTSKIRHCASAPSLKLQADLFKSRGNSAETEKLLALELARLNPTGHNDQNNSDNDQNNDQRTPSPDDPPLRQQEPPATIVTIGGYEVGELLGKGAFGEVYGGVHQVTRDVVALKFLTKNRLVSASDAQKVFTEIHCLETLNHKHVIQLLGK